MKASLHLAFSVSLALAQVVSAQDQDQDKNKAPKPKPKATQPARHVPPPQNAPQAPNANRNPTQTNPSDPKSPYPARAYNPTTRNAFLPRPTPPAQTNPHGPNENGHHRTDPDGRNHNWHDHDRDRDWNNQHRSPNHSWTEARARHHREYHDRYWWRNHYTRFALFGTGYFFWDGGYWYPAYGYDPTYNTYDYEEPIYAPNDLEPSDVISNVQTELQRLGYYSYAVDGLMGPATRAAIADYQRDYGLENTSAIDQPTLESLGLE